MNLMKKLTKWSRKFSQKGCIKNSFQKIKVSLLKKSTLPTPLKYSLQDVKVSLLKKVLYLPP